MANKANFTLKPSRSIYEALQALEKTKISTCIVVNNEMKVIGSLTDGDIRRGLLAGLSKEDSVDKIMNTSPLIESIGANENLLRKKCLKNDINVIPLVDSQGVLKNIFIFNTSEQSKPKKIDHKKDITAFILAGGEGKRLRPITYSTPKPLVKINKKTLIQNNITFLNSYGIQDIYVSVHYMAEQIINHIDSLEKKNMKIGYLKERNKLGTAGPLSLLENKKYKHVLVMNADLLCSFSIDKLIDNHIKTKADVTVVITERSTKIPFGVIEIDKKEQILSITEKPTIKHFCLAGIYLIKSNSLDAIPENQYLDMPDFLNTLVKKDKKISVFPLIPEFEEWNDIGTIAALSEAEDKNF